MYGSGEILSGFCPISPDIIASPDIASPDIAISDETAQNAAGCDLNTQRRRTFPAVSSTPMATPCVKTAIPSAHTTVACAEHMVPTPTTVIADATTKLPLARTRAWLRAAPPNTEPAVYPMDRAVNILPITVNVDFVVWLSSRRAGPRDAKTRPKHPKHRLYAHIKRPRADQTARCARSSLTVSTWLPVKPTDPADKLPPPASSRTIPSSRRIAPARRLALGHTRC